MSSSTDFAIYYKQKYASLTELVGDKGYDLLISGFNDSERVKSVFSDINATEKHWLIFPEYQYSKDELPVDGTSVKIFDFSGLQTKSEGEIIRNYFGGFDLSKFNRICIDITGFVRPHLIFLVRYLSSSFNESVDFIYSDPITYKKKEETSFSFDYTDVRQVEGFQGIHIPDSSNDLLIIGAGYDDQRITDVAKKKANARKVQLFGFPSLQPDMFQENIVKAYKAEEASSSGRENFIDRDSTLFAPANDPFVTADVLQEHIRKENKAKAITNLYLCPLSTKAQTLGFAIYYLAATKGTATSIIFPFCERYSRETTEGISKIWRYTINLSELVKI